MFNSLRGIITFSEEQTLYLLLNGMEFELTVPLTTSNRFNEGDEARIFTYLHHKEDSMRLFGFHSEAQRELFLKLLKVEGIGPKQGISIIGATSPTELIALLEREDTQALSSIPGIGAKKAAKIILALRGKLTAERKEKGGITNSPYGDLVKALVDMGFAAKEAESVVAQLVKELNPGESDFEQRLFREAIVRLSSF